MCWVYPSVRMETTANPPYALEQGLLKSGRDQGGEIAEAGGGERGDIQQGGRRWPPASGDSLVRHLVDEFRRRSYTPH